jgi:hypothetical protein
VNKQTNARKGSGAESASFQVFSTRRICDSSQQTLCTWHLPTLNLFIVELHITLIRISIRVFSTSTSSSPSYTFNYSQNINSHSSCYPSLLYYLSSLGTSPPAMAPRGHRQGRQGLLAMDSPPTPVPSSGGRIIPPVPPRTIIC